MNIVARRNVYSGAVNMHAIDDVNNEPARRLLSGYSDVIRKVHVGRNEVILQWRTRKACEKHCALVRLLGALGYESIIHRKGKTEFGWSEVKSRGIGIYDHDV
jgi:hypothetical protein